MSRNNPDPVKGTILITALLRNDGTHNLQTTMSFVALVNEQAEAAGVSLMPADEAADLLYSRGRQMLDEALTRMFNGKTGGFNFPPTTYIADEAPNAPFARVEWVIPEGQGTGALTCQIIPLAGAKRQQMDQWNTIIARGLMDLAYGTRSRQVKQESQEG